VRDLDARLPRFTNHQPNPKGFIEGATAAKLLDISLCSIIDKSVRVHPLWVGVAEWQDEKKFIAPKLLISAFKCALIGSLPDGCSHV
jgi:hypothetical protein